MAEPSTQERFKRGAADAGRYFDFMAQFVDFQPEHAEAIRATRFVVEKHIPAIVADFYNQLLSFPATRKLFLDKQGNIDQDYLALRMQHQATFWRRTAAAVFDEDYARFIDYVGRAHTSQGADPSIYIPERYVMGMVGFVQQRIGAALDAELHDVDPDLAFRAIRGWNALLMVLLELLSRVYGEGREAETFQAPEMIDAGPVQQLALETYERSLGMARSVEYREVCAGAVAEFAGDGRKVITAEGLSVGVFLVAGQWHALQNSCLHRGGPVCKGPLTDGILTCPWHGYQYKLATGELLLDPDAKLPRYPVEVRGDQVYLRIPVLVRDAVDVSLADLFAKADAPSTDHPEDAASAPRDLAANEFDVAGFAPGQIKLVAVAGVAVAVYNTARARDRNAKSATERTIMARPGHLLYESKEQNYTTLRQPWLNIARVLWIIFSAAALIALLVGAVLAWGAPLPDCTAPGAACGPWSVSREDLALAQQAGLPVQAMVVISLATAVVVKLIFFLVGVFIFWRRSDDWIALLLSLMLTLFALEGVDNLGPWMPVVTVLYAVAALIFVLLPFVFPNGRFAPSWTQWVFWPLAIASMLTTVLPQLGLPIDDRIYALALITPFGVWFVVAVYAVIYRYTRISNLTERQQTKWVMAGFLGTFILFIPFILVTIFFPPSQPSLERVMFMYVVYLPLYVFAYLCLPAGIAFAILRYRLYDIDVIIRRTLVYATVTGLLALVYFGSIITLQAVFQSMTGERSAFVIVLSTLLIAALFTPLRRRIQAVIDRRFFRKKYDAQQVLARFAITARDETDMNALSVELMNVVKETMAPTSMSIWLQGVGHVEQQRQDSR